MTHSRRALIVGIDAGDKNLIFQWAKSGELPGFASLIDKGLIGHLDNPKGHYVGAIWPTFSTSVNTAKHGRFCFRQITSGTYEIQSTQSRQYPNDFFWTSLSKQGKRVAVIDVPKTNPQKPLNGIQVIDWLSHDADYTDFITTPPSLAKEIQEHHGKNPMPKCDEVRHNAEDFKLLKNNLIKRIDMKKNLALEILKQEPWDCFVTVICEGHCAGHHCWHLNDKNHARYDSKLCDDLGNPLLDAYKKIDTAVHQITEQADPNTIVFVLASHGMGPLYGANHLLDEFLRRLDGLEKNKFNIIGLAKTLWRCLPEKFRFKLFKGMRNQLRTTIQKTDFKNRSYFAVPNNDAHGAIRFNLVGREPNGKVQPGKQYNELCHYLTQELMKISNVDTGKSIVKAIHRSDKLFPNDNRETLPDLMIDWDRTSPINNISHPKLGKIQGSYLGCRSGDHRDHGFFIAKGPNIKKGELDEPVSIMDFGPTVADILGLELPQTDGKSFLSQMQSCE